MKSIVIFYSRAGYNYVNGQIKNLKVGNTEIIAKRIAESLSADIFEIEPRDEYSTEDLDWTDNNSRVTKEHEDESLRNIELVSTTVENWESYDTVLIGYPIW